MKKILIADDVIGWTEFHKTNIKYLNIENVTIDTVNSAKDALSKIETSVDEPYTTIFTDLRMESDYLPELAGEWLIKQIKTFKQYNDTKIVIVSADAKIAQIAKKYNVMYAPKSLVRVSDAEIYRQYV